MLPSFSTALSSRNSISLQLGNPHTSFSCLREAIPPFLLPTTCPSADTQINPTAWGRPSTPGQNCCGPQAQQVTPCALLSVTLGCPTWASLHDAALLGFALCASPRALSCFATLLPFSKGWKPICAKCSWCEGSEFPHPSKKWFAGVELDVTQGQRRESGFSHCNSVLQFPRSSTHGHLTNQTSWGAKTPAPQSSTPKKIPKHHEVVPPFSASCTSCEMYNTPHLHWGLCTSQQHKFPNLHSTASANPGCFLKALEFLNLCYTTQSGSSPALWDGKLMARNG